MYQYDYVSRIIKTYTLVTFMYTLLYIAHIDIIVYYPNKPKCTLYLNLFTFNVYFTHIKLQHIYKLT